MRGGIPSEEEKKKKERSKVLEIASCKCFELTMIEILEELPVQFDYLCILLFPKDLQLSYMQM